jgi:hypothetical protein
MNGIEMSINFFSLVNHPRKVNSSTIGIITIIKMREVVNPYLDDKDSSVPNISLSIKFKLAAIANSKAVANLTAIIQRKHLKKNRNL